jgi:hypothetical protein
MNGQWPGPLVRSRLRAAHGAREPIVWEVDVFVDVERAVILTKDADATLSRARAPDRQGTWGASTRDPTTRALGSRSVDFGRSRRELEQLFVHAEGLIVGLIDAPCDSLHELFDRPACGFPVA